MIKISSFLLLLSLIACSSKKPEEKPIIYPRKAAEVRTTNPKNPTIATQQLAAEEGSNTVTEIKFQKNKSSLTKTAKDHLKSLHKESLKHDDLKRIIILSWSDKEFLNKKDLNRKDYMLAEKRSQSIKQYLKEIDSDFKFEEVNMTKTPAKISNFFNTTNAEIKKSIEDQESFKDKASHAIVIFTKD